MEKTEKRAIEFRQLQEKILDRLRDASNLAEFGDLTKSLSVQEFRSLEFLNSSVPPMMRELAEYLRLAVNSVTEIVDSLEHRGLAERRRDDNDRRITRICLTKKGAEAADTIHSGFLFIYRRYLSALTEAEQETLLAIYRKIATVERALEASNNLQLVRLPISQMTLIASRGRAFSRTRLGEILEFSEIASDFLGNHGQ